MRGRLSSFGILFLLVPTLAFGASALPASCRTVRVSVSPSPQGKLEAVIARSDCDDRKSQLSHPWTTLYIVEPGRSLDTSNPLYLFGFPEGHESVISIRKGVPLRIRWDAANRLTIHYPLGTVVRTIPWGD